MEGNRDSLGKFISLILRHNPSVIGITIDEHGWANVNELIKGINQTKHYFITIEDLKEIVRTDKKMRYSFNPEQTLIRANQGHSIPVDVELQKVSPPKILYHGTAEKYVESIKNDGLISKNRLYVHLSYDYDTAQKVGSRHGNPVVYQVLAEEMEKDGFEFFKSLNGVWLTKKVPVKYLRQLKNYEV